MTKTLFSRVPVDQPCKEAEGKGTGGGTEVFSLKIRAISKYYPSNIIGDELLLNFGGEIPAFMCEITKLPWQPFRISQCQDGDEV